MRAKYLGARYVVDRVFAVVILAVISPLMLIIAAIVLCTSGRPILFRQERAGRNGKAFAMIKFRTLVAGGDRINADGYSPLDRNLITPIGRLLRATSLDELPQLINVTRGEMALIGPRPSLLAQYERCTPRQRRRVEALPGLTGLAQVTYRDRAPWAERIELDLEYIDRAGPLLDLIIVLRTMRRMIPGATYTSGGASATS